MYSADFQKLKKKVNSNLKISVSVGVITFALICFSAFFTEEKYVVNILFGVLAIAAYIGINTITSLWRCPHCDEVFGSTISKTYFCPHCGINLEDNKLRENVRPPSNTPLNETKTKELREFLKGTRITLNIKCPYCHTYIAKAKFGSGAFRPAPWGKWCYHCGASFMK